MTLGDGVAVASGLIRSKAVLSDSPSTDKLCFSTIGDQVKVKVLLLRKYSIPNQLDAIAFEPYRSVVAKRNCIHKFTIELNFNDTQCKLLHISNLLLKIAIPLPP